MIAKFIMREVYGNVLYYPDNALAFSLCNLVAKKSMPKHKFKDIEDMGFTIDIVNSYDPRPKE